MKKRKDKSNKQAVMLKLGPIARNEYPDFYDIDEEEEHCCEYASTKGLTIVETAIIEKCSCGTCTGDTTLDFLFDTLVARKIEHLLIPTQQVILDVMEVQLSELIERASLVGVNLHGDPVSDDMACEAITLGSQAAAVL